MKKLLMGLFVLFLSFSFGCGIQMRNISNGQPQTERLFSKNYAIGEILTANVGEPVLKFQDYYKIITENLVVVPDRDTKLQGKIGELSFTKGEEYDIRGEITIKNQNFLAISSDEHKFTGLSALLKHDGTLHNKVINQNPMDGSQVVVIWDFINTNPETKFARTTSEEFDKKNGYENYEIIYSGINENSLNLTYREFSPDGLARVAFYQNLTYKLDTKLLTFKKFKIEVIEANSQYIVYKVISD